MNMRKYLFIVLLAMCFDVLVAQQQQVYLDYIAQYRTIALEQQTKYQIPASITLAQGLLESGAGRSELAVYANNHFGIKCTSEWAGATYRHDDDRLQECFRKYSKPQDSYRDHSLFLKRKRYESLFELPLSDYKGWAEGLSRCGYATDPKYPAKLIKIIEDYGLANLVADAPADLPATNVSSPAVVDTILSADTIDLNNLPDFREKAAMEEVSMYYEHRSGKQNGVRYIVAEEGESFATLSYQLNMSESALRRFNDATDGRDLEKGNRVYLYPKKSKADRKHAYYYVRQGDTAWSIAQKFGIKMRSIYQLNGIPENIPLKTRQQLRLR